MGMRAGRRRVEDYIPRLYGYAYSLSGDSHDSHDLVQDTAVKALKASRVPEDEPAFRSWLFVILRNTWQDKQRKRNRTPEVGGEDESYEEIGSPIWEHDDSLISTLTVKHCLTRLTPAHREILGLVDVSGFSYVEASEILGVPVGTVMSRITRARNSMLSHLETGNVHQFPANNRQQTAK